MKKKDFLPKLSHVAVLHMQFASIRTMMKSLPDLTEDSSGIERDESIDEWGMVSEIKECRPIVVVQQLLGKIEKLKLVPRPQKDTQNLFRAISLGCGTKPIQNEFSPG